MPRRAVVYVACRNSPAAGGVPNFGETTNELIAEPPWLPSDAQRAAMPLALDLSGLYEPMLKRLIPLPARQQESLADLVTRAEHVASKQREVEQAVSKLAKEKKFNRKVDINNKLNALKAELARLKK